MKPPFQCSNPLDKMRRYLFTFEIKLSYKILLTQMFILVIQEGGGGGGGVAKTNHIMVKTNTT